MSKIEVVGLKGLHDKSKIKDDVIYLGGNWYLKTDRENLTKVPRLDTNGNQIGWRLFRRNSVLIVQLGNNHFYEKKDCVCTDDGIFILKHKAIKVNNRWYRKEYCVQINNSWYLKTDPNITSCIKTGKFKLKSDCLLLSREVYNKKGDVYISKAFSNEVVEVLNFKGLVFRRDVTTIYNRDKQPLYFCHNDPCLSKMRKIDIFLKWREPNNPDPSRVVFGRTTDEYLDGYSRSSVLGNIYVNNNEIQRIESDYNDYVERTKRKDIEKVRTTMDQNYDDSGPDENKAGTISLNYKTYPGKHPLCVPEKPPIEVSKSLSLTGGIGYTFGVEAETSAGMLTNKTCELLNLDKMGDRSIGSAEYVTMPLHGDKGVLKLKEVFKHLSEGTFVDNRCGLHIHIGGAEGTDSPSFNRLFNINAIRLGCQIESDLFKISPPSRYPRMKHCHSILAYSKIRPNDWKRYLGTYLFSGLEDFSVPKDMSNYIFGEDGRTSDSTIGTWSGSRYKWLNLIHCATNSRIKTIEFRIFAGTTNYEKVYNYLMICFAFVWFVDNRQGLIEKGDVTLNLIISEAFSKNEEIRSKVLSFISERKSRFKRTNKSMYGKYVTLLNQ